MIDFAALVLGPAMATFGQPITVTPVVSQPGKPAYSTKADGISQLTGIYASKPVQIRLNNGDIHSTVQPSLGIRLADFAVAPMQGDTVATTSGTFEIADINPDGQGGADCPLRDLDADTATTDEDGA